MGLNWQQWQHYLFNPFIVGSLTGIISGNLSLGLITTGFAFLIWGYNRGLNFIILTTIILVVLTGNMNFELIFLFILTIAYLIKQKVILSSFDQGLNYIIWGIISIILYPLWKYIFGVIPAQVLNEINIAGTIILLTGLVLSTIRGIKFVQGNPGDRKGLLRYLVAFLMAATGFIGTWIVLPLWLGGILIREHLAKDKVIVSIPDHILSLIMIGVTVVTGYFLLPLNLIVIIGLSVIIIYIYLKREQIPLMEMVYLSFIMGLIAGRLGLLS